MAKKATAKAAGGTSKKLQKAKSGGSGSGRSSSTQSDAVDALIKLLQSPLVIDLLAVGATAALAAITESRSSRVEGAAGTNKKALKAAGKAAAARWDAGSRQSSTKSAKCRGKRANRGSLRPTQQRNPRSPDLALKLDRIIARLDGIAAIGFDGQPTRGREPFGIRDGLHDRCPRARRIGRVCEDQIERVGAGQSERRTTDDTRTIGNA